MAVTITLTPAQVDSVIEQAGSPTGPTGPTAPTGPTGPTAPTGPTGPTVSPPVNLPPNNGVTWHAPARFVPENTNAKGNFNYLMKMRSSFGLCYAAVSSSNIGTNLKSIPNIGTLTEQNNIINTFANSSYNFGAPANLFLPTLPKINGRVPYSFHFKWGETGEEICVIPIPYPNDDNPIGG